VHTHIKKIRVTCECGQYWSGLINEIESILPRNCPRCGELTGKKDCVDLAKKIIFIQTGPTLKDWKGGIEFEVEEKNSKNGHVTA